MSSLTPVFMVEGSFRQKEKEREPFSKSGMVLVPSTIKYIPIIWNLTLLLSICDRTFRKGCPFAISLRATDDGKGLQMTRFHKDHNHEIS